MVEEETGSDLLQSERVEKSIETEDKDMFDDVFGEDEDEKAAKKKMHEKAEELKKQKANKAHNAGQNGGPDGNGKDDEDDEDEEIEEESAAGTEPEIFGEIAGEEKGEASDDAGEEKKKTSKNGSGRGMGGKLDLKVTHEEEDEEEELAPAHPIEKKIIKSVIKNKALMSAKSEVNLNRGIKISDETIKKKKKEEGGEEHEELAEALLREDGTKEEGISESEEAPDEDVSEEDSGPRMPKAKIVEEEPAENEGQEKEGKILPDLEFLMSNRGHAFIGRKKSVLGKYGEEAGLFVGRVNEKEKEGTEILMDGLNPHVIFVCGARGSGKSYVLGVIAEELAMKNKNVGIVVVDPIGVFWSMKHPNKEEKELESLAKWGLLPRGLDNIKVFIPVGMKDAVPKSTYDAVFSIQPALLTAEDWCLTFGIDRFSPTGLLMEKGIAKVKSGYSTIEEKEVRGKLNTFTLEDLIRCFENDAELNDKERGYKADSIRALASRFDAAKHWGIFDDKGTSLGLLSRAGQMTILDTSFLEDNVSALVIGIISRRLLAARKLGTRREAAEKFDDAEMDEITELNIPPTWLFIDEAHTLIPAGNQKTPASNALVEYVKQGRRPGCSLVFATQQPSAIDSKVLSQLDIIMAHKLVFDDDIKSTYKRTPAIVPHQYKKANFIKTMPVGIALVGDRSETTSRAFIMAIRPRMSQHEGRDAETTEVKHELEQNQVQVLAVNILLRQLEKDPSIRIDSIKETLDNLNNTYKKDVGVDAILEALKEKGVTIKDDSIFAPGAEEELEAEREEAGEELLRGEKLKGSKKAGLGEDGQEEKIGFDEKVELMALKPSIDEQRARKILAGNISKKFMFLDDEILDRLALKYAVIYKVDYKYFSHRDSFHSGEAFINSLTGEFIHDDRGTLKESKGLSKLLGLSEPETTVLKLVAEKKRVPREVALAMKMEEGNAKRILDSLIKKNFLAVAEQNNKNFYVPSKKLVMDLPPHPLHDMLSSMGKRPITEIETAALVSPNMHEKEVPELLKKLWGNIAVKQITHLFLPVWEGTLKKKTGEERTIIIDAINGNRVST